MMSEVPNGSSAVFIGGPITWALHCGGFCARTKDVIRGLQATLIRAGFTVYSAHIAEGFGGYVPDPKSIVTRDLSWLEQSDVALFVIPDDSAGVPLRTDGTFVEIGYALARGLDTIILVDSFEKQSPMITGLKGLYPHIEVLPLQDYFPETERVISCFQLIANHKPVLTEKGGLDS